MLNMLGELWLFMVKSFASILTTTIDFFREKKDLLELLHTPSVLHSEAYWLGKRFVNSPAPKPLGASGASAHVLYSRA